jgi:hypothetical protein
MALPGCGDDAADDTSTGGGTIEVQVSGEEIGTDGFLFPTGSEVTIADGWEIEFSHVLVTVGGVTVSSDPDRNPSDQSETGAVVARADGPWAIDLHTEGTVPGIGGEGTAVPLATIESQDDGSPFAADERYALGFSIVAASSDAEKLNFDGNADADALYDEMIAEGYSILLAGTATFKGETCETSDDTYDFSQVPESVTFKLGFASPTSYVNCQNEENDGDPFPDEEFQRGIAVPANAAATAQLTLHLDHFLYSDVEHEPLLYFGQIAARLVGAAETMVTMDDLAGLDPTAFTDGSGAPLPWRVCDGSPVPQTAQMSFEVGSVPLDASADPADALRDYRDYMTYVTSTLGHLNGGEGLCYVERDYPSPR